MHSFYDRLMAAGACAFFLHQVVSALRTGRYKDIAHPDVDAARNPVAFVLTVVVGILLVILLGILVVLPNAKEVSASSQRPATISHKALLLNTAMRISLPE